MKGFLFSNQHRKAVTKILFFKSNFWLAGVGLISSNFGTRKIQANFLQNSIFVPLRGLFLVRNGFVWFNRNQMMFVFWPGN